MLRVSKKNKLWECCADKEYIPAMSYIYFDDNKVIATNAHVIVRIDYDVIFPLITDKEIIELRGRFLFGKYMRMLSALRSDYNITIEDGVIIAKYGYMEQHFKTYTAEEMEAKKMRFPIEYVRRYFDSARQETCIEFHNIGVNVLQLEKVCGAFGTKDIKVHASTATNAMYVTPRKSDICGVEAVVMPVLLDN